MTPPNAVQAGDVRVAFERLEHQLRCGLPVSGDASEYSAGFAHGHLVVANRIAVILAKEETPHDPVTAVDVAFNHHDVDEMLIENIFHSCYFDGLSRENIAKGFDPKYGDPERHAFTASPLPTPPPTTGDV